MRTHSSADKYVTNIESQLSYNVEYFETFVYVLEMQDGIKWEFVPKFEEKTLKINEWTHFL